MTTVREMIEKLQEHDPDAIMCCHGRDEYFDVEEPTAGFVSIRNYGGNDEGISDFLPEDGGLLEDMATERARGRKAHFIVRVVKAVSI